MKLWDLDGHRRNREEQTMFSLTRGNLNLSLVDAMHDLDPGMLAWSPPRDGSAHMTMSEHVVASSDRPRVRGFSG